MLLMPYLIIVGLRVRGESRVSDSCCAKRQQNRSQSVCVVSNARSDRSEQKQPREDGGLLCVDYTAFPSSLAPLGIKHDS